VGYRFSSMKGAIVTGGANGIGKEVVFLLIKEGYKVVIADIDQKAAEECLSKIERGNAVFEYCNTTEENALRRSFERLRSEFGRGNKFDLVVVCNNAGIGENPVSMHQLIQGNDIDINLWKRLIDINLNAVIDGTFVAMQEISRMGAKGIIINTASTGGLTSMPFSPVYSASKWGVVGFSRSIAYIASQFNIRIGCICPSFTSTKLLDEGMKASDDVSNLAKNVIGILSTEQVAQAFMTIIQDQSLTGAVVSVTPSRGMEIKTRENVMNYVPLQSKM